MLELPLENVLITSDAGLTENDEDPLMLRELTVTAGKLLGDSIFGLEKYLSWGTKIHETLVTTGAAMLFTTLVLCGCFFIFTLAYLSNIARFGLLGGMAILVAFLSDILVAPALIILLDRSSTKWGLKTRSETR